MNDDALTEALLAQAEWWFDNTFRPRMNGLTDEEFLWEPTSGAWSLRPTDDERVVYDFEWPPPTPAPVTTIAWRLCHIAVGCLALRTSRYLPDESFEPWTQNLWDGPLAFPTTADGALGFLDEWWERWRSGLRRIGDRGLWEPLGSGGEAPNVGPDDPTIGLVLHIHRELMHHGAEINLLRDLYAAKVAERSMTP